MTNPSPKTVSREPGDLGTYEDAVTFALDVHDDSLEAYGFLNAWREGELSDWPEYYEWLAGRPTAPSDPSLSDRELQDEEAAEIASILRERVDQDFDGECRLTSAEAARIITFCARARTSPAPVVEGDAVERVARAAFAADMQDGHQTIPAGFDFGAAWDTYATMPLSGEGFVRKWTIIARAALSQPSPPPEGELARLRHALEGMVAMHEVNGGYMEAPEFIAAREALATRTDPATGGGDWPLDLPSAQPPLPADKLALIRVTGQAFDALIGREDRATERSKLRGQKDAALLALAAEGNG